MFLVAAWALPVSLPPESVSEDWEEALRVAGLDTRQGGAVALASGPEMWTLTVTDATGDVHRVQVPAPANHADREEIAWLAASLLEVEPAPSLPAPSLPPPPEPVVQRPEPVQPHVVRVEAPSVAQVEPDLAVEVPTSLSVALGISDRAAVDLALGAHRGPWWAAAGVRGFEPAVDVPEAGMQLARMQLGVQQQVGALVGSFAAGTELRQWTAPRAASQWSLMPTATLGVGVAFRVGPLALVPRLSATADLRPTTVIRGDEVRQQRLHGGLHVVFSRSR
jgi:hypothetical protein